MTDIRSFFKPVSFKTNSQSKGSASGKRKRTDDKPSYSSKTKKPNIIYDSDNSDDDVATAKSQSKANSNGNRKTPSKKLDVSPKPLKTTSAIDFFGSGPIQRSVKKERKTQAFPISRKSASEEHHEDDDFQKTLFQIDEESTPKKRKKMEADEPASSPRRSSRRSFAASSPAPSEKSASDETKTLSSKLSSKLKKIFVEDTPPVRRSSPRKSVTQNVVKESPDNKISSRTQSTTPNKNSSRKASVTPVKSNSKTPARKTPTKKAATSKSKLEFTKKESKPKIVETTPPKTPKDGKRKANPSYFSYLNREGPQALGTKEIPEGAAGCLDNCTFVITGILDSIEKGDAIDLIKRHGGKVTTSISKKTKYLVVGRGAGEKKLEKAEEFGIKQLTEDDLFELIRTRPGKKGSVKPIKSIPESPIEEQSFEIEEADCAASSQSQTLDSQSSTSSSQLQAPYSEMIQSQSESQNSQHSLSDSQLPSSISTQESLMWVDKYKPKNIKQIIGQHGDKSNVKKLMRWLKEWDTHNATGTSIKGKYNRDTGAGCKAALLSGPPGIGKTTSATLVCKEVGYSFVEFNASDTRSKKSLQTVVSELLDNQDITTLMSRNLTVKNQKHCLIMDEVDGMAGNEDRGGMQELIQLIKSSKIPIICMCNDRMHQKIRSLANHCFDLRFQRPQVKQIKASMMSVACKEGIKIPPQAMDDIIIASNQDIRQVLHNLSMWTAGQKSITHEQLKSDANNAKKDMKLGPFEVVRRVFTSGVERSKMSLNDKFNLFFHDYSMGPLFVQENYISVVPQEGKSDKKKHLDLLSKTADSLCNSDLIDKSIRSRNSWNLLPTQALFASVLPGEYMQGFMSHMINFPSWLGKNSTRNKNYRLLQELQQHMRLPTSGSLQDINLAYCPHLRGRLTDPLLQRENQGVPEVIQLLDDYDLTRDDLSSLLEVSQFGKNDTWSRVPSKVKSAFTRAYNQASHLLPHSNGDIKKKRGQQTADADDDDAVQEADESDEDISSDPNVKKIESKTDASQSKKGKSNVKGKSKVKKSK
ncbi:replication factor C subunit 1-like [Anneissia japonica]|uniref:replication factor C subunit 1-like n=1 Tax=Anneissia japonica TaxID=1529436 RepID=UPI0014257179|nr:replication factor C subunit 1-like [Anneissia japonica]